MRFQVLLLPFISVLCLLYYLHSFSLPPGPVNRNGRFLASQAAFTTHGFNFVFRPKQVHYPESVEEIRHIVSLASQNGSLVEDISRLLRFDAREKVRVIGAAHSWNPLVQTSDNLISLDKFDKILHVDTENQRATFQVGIRIGNLARELEKFGLALRNMGTTDKQSFAGAFMTGTHGTGSQFGIIASSIVSLQIIDGLGEIHEASAERNPDLFAAARVSLGTLGVVTSVTIQCEKFYWLKRTYTPSTLDETLSNINEIDAQNRNFKMWWIPRTPYVRQIRWNYLPKPQNSSLATQLSVIIDSIKSGAAIALMQSLAPYADRTYPFLMGLIGTVFNTYEEIEGPYYDILPSPSPYTHQESEWFIPGELAVEAYKAYRKVLEESNCWTNMISELRFIAADDSWLSPAYNRSSATINMLLVGNNAEFERCSPLMEAALGPKSRFQGRPHWGKVHQVLREDLAAVYPKWNDFQALRRHFDPRGVFLNSYLKQLMEV